MNIEGVLNKDLHDGEPTPLENIVFPYEVFPEDLNMIINELYDKLQYPKEYTAGALIFAVSVITGNTRRIELKTGYTDSASVFLINVGRAGANKTRPFKDILKPIRKKDFEALQEYKRKLQNYKDELTSEKPDEVNYIVSDFTPEYLIKALSQNPRGVSVFVDEILGWLKNLDKYTKGSSLEFYLSLWSGITAKVNRATQETLSVERPFTSIAGTIQPSRLIKEFKDKEDNGFLDRFLFIYPTKQEKDNLNEAPVDKSILNSWEVLVSQLYSNLDDTQETKYTTCTTEARRMLIKWINDHKGENEDENITGLFQKLHSYLLRLTLIVYIMEWITGENKEGVINEQTAEKGIKLVEYFKETALKVRAEMYSNDTYLDSLSEDKQALYNRLNERFRTSEAVEEGEKLNIPSITVKRFITDKRLFKKLAHGVYEKKYH